MADVTRNGALRAADPAKLLEATARTKIGPRDIARAMPPGLVTPMPSCPAACRPPGGCMESFCAFSSSSPTVGRSAGSSRWGTTTTTRTLSSFVGVFWHTRAVIGHVAARAFAQRAKVDGHILRRPRAAPNVRDARCSSRPPYRRSSRFFWVPSGLGSRFSWCLVPYASRLQCALCPMLLVSATRLPNNPVHVLYYLHYVRFKSLAEPAFRESALATRICWLGSTVARSILEQPAGACRFRPARWRTIGSRPSSQPSLGSIYAGCELS